LDSGIYNAVRGCRTEGLRFDMIANNLANIGTAGFKKDMVYFDQALRMHVTTDLSQGNIRRTGNPLDVALEGEGFFKVQTPAGVRYTANGRFQLNAEGLLVTSNGDPVLGSGGPISIQGKDITINDRGQIEVDESAVDRLSLASFQRPERLQKEGSSYYIYNGDEKEISEPQQTSVKQGYIEESNVVVTDEMIRMVEALRNFESYQKVLQTFDETDARVVNEVGKP
jgi:flagellar basal-body rod protein FlgF